MPAAAPRVLALDINETVSDLSGLAPRLEEVGAPSSVLRVWFASTLRDGFALTAAGGYADFATVATAALLALLPAVDTLNRDPQEAAAHVLAGMAELPLHPDVRPALERLSETSIRLVALTNGSAEVTQKLLQRGGVSGLIERCLSVEAARRWKPAPEPYLMAAARCGVDPEEVMLAAVHPWDVDGAKRCGLRAAWIDRGGGGSYPPHLLEPDLSCAGFAALADALAGEGFRATAT